MSARVPRPLLLANRGFQLGGGEVGLEMLARHLLDRGVRPVVVLPTPGSLLAHLPVDRRVANPQALRDELRSAAAVCDVVHTYSAQGLVQATDARLGIPTVLHALVPNPTKADADLAARADLVICNSDATARRFAGAPNVRVVHNGVAAPNPLPAGSPLVRMGQRTVALVGGVCVRKGQLDVLPALTELVGRRADVDVIFIGRASGLEGRALRRAVEGNPQLRVTGFVPDAAAHLAHVDLVLVPSRSEGFGRVAVEALRAGTPVLASPVEGLVEALAGIPDPWLLGRPEQWPDQIEAELDSPHVGPEVLRAAGARFAPESFVDAVVAAYRGLCDIEYVP